MRIDKWLWAARFFKTRQLSAKAVKTGKIALNGQAISKPAATIAVGHEVSIKRGLHRLEVEVLALSEQRGPAKVAATLYAETQASIENRETLRQQLAAQPKVEIDRRKPEKRSLRQHRAFKRHQE